jgi:hypothetical protein
MHDLPISAGWYWYLSHMRGVLRRLQAQHEHAMKRSADRSPAAIQAGMAAQRDASIAVEYIDRYLRTMEAAGVLSGQ